MFLSVLVKATSCTRLMHRLNSIAIYLKLFCILFNNRLLIEFTPNLQPFVVQYVCNGVVKNQHVIFLFVLDRIFD